MIDLVAAALVVLGSLLMLLAAIGVLRLPDVYVRLQASTKAASLGAGCLLVALILEFGDLAVGVRAVLAITFVFLTVPVSGHLIGRAAYLTGVPLWEGTAIDELRSHSASVDAAAAAPVDAESASEADDSVADDGELDRDARSGADGADGSARPA